MSYTKACFSAGFFFCAMLLGGCAVMTPQSQLLKEHSPADIPRRVELTEVQFFPQEDYQCGPAALAMALNAAGLDVAPEALVDQVYLPARRGSLQVEMLATARRKGLVAYPLAPNMEDIIREIAAQTPVIVLQNYGVSWFPLWHYAVVVGYDLERSEFVLRSGQKQRLVIPTTVFEYLWKDGGYWSMVAVPPSRIPATANEQGYATAASALEKSGPAKAARTAYSTLLERWPESLVGLMGAGNTAYSMGDLKDAETMFSKAAEIHSGSVAALNNLAQTLADQGNLLEAIIIARRAAELGGPLHETARSTLEDITRKLEAGESETRNKNPEKGPDCNT
jgi:tetratricopeptide (TPR) repeat protein